MIITLSPQRRDDTLTVSKSGDSLTINGEVFDFTPLTAGSTLPAAAIVSDWICGDVSRDTAGELAITLTLPVGPNPSQAQAFPAAITDPADGDITLP